MTYKQFPPAQALRAVPLEEAAIVRAWHECDDVLASEPLSFAPALDKVLEFVEQFRPKEAPDMVVAGGLSEVRIIDDGIDEAQINLVRLNGRVFAPEFIAVSRPRSGIIAKIAERAATELVDNFAKQLDEDDLEQIITDSLDPDWHPRLAARAIHAELYGKGEE